MEGNWRFMDKISRKSEMSDSNSNFYSPLDQSQLEFVPSDLVSVYEGEIEAGRPDGPRRSPSQNESVDASSIGNVEASKKHPGYFDELFLRKRISSQASEHSDVNTLSRISSATSRSSVEQRIRYRIVLRLKPKERSLLRDTWAMILNDDSTNNIAAYSKTRQVKQAKQAKPKGTASSPQKARVAVGHSRQGLAPNNASGEVKVGAHANSFTSSLFCSQFYANLLSMDPLLEQMFPSTEHQAVAFAGVVTAAINNLENLQVLENFLNGLGKRHARILGIEAPHFELMGVAFLKTLQDRFGIHCTVQVEEAWSKLYSYLANSILQFGIDPILHIHLEEDTLELPVPNLVEATPKTIINLKQNMHADQQSLGASISSGEESSRRSLPDVIRRAHKEAVSTQSSIKRATISTRSSKSMAPASIATPSPTARRPIKFELGKKAQNKKAEVRKSFTKSSASSSNKDCIVM